MKKLIALIVSLCMLAGMLPAMAETAAEAPAQAPAEAEKVDVNRLVEQLMADVQNAVVRVDMAEAKEKSATPLGAHKGNVFTVMKKVMTEAAAALAKDGKEDPNVTTLIAGLDELDSAKDVDEQELELLSSLVVIGIAASAQEKIASDSEEDYLKGIAIANSILKAVYETCQENEKLADAVKATGSRLFEMLLNNNGVMKEYVEKNGALTVVSVEEDNKYYADFEAEVKKVRDHLTAAEGQKQSALDMLDLLHSVLDDIHNAINGNSARLPADGDALVGEMIGDLVEAVNSVELDSVKAKAGDEFDTKGGVYAVLEKIVKKISDDASVDEKEIHETMDKVAEMLGKLDAKDVTEEQAEAVFGLLLLGLADAAEKAEAAEEAAEAADPAIHFRRASAIMKAAYTTLLENEAFNAAVKATGSKLPEMLEENDERLKKYLEENGTLHVVPDADEAPFIAFDAELAKVREYLAAQEGGESRKAVRLLDLIHEYTRDIRLTLDGRAQEEVVKQLAAFGKANFGMNMDDVIAAVALADYEIENELVQGPVTFSELKYDNVEVDGKKADTHYLFVGNELVAVRVCFKDGAVTFDQAVADLAEVHGQGAIDVDWAALGNGVYAVSKDGKLEGRAAAIAADGLMIVIGELKDEVEVTFLDLAAAYILAQY